MALINPLKGEQIPLIPLDPPPRKSAKQRRHSPKGKASGWIEERLGNCKRRNPSTSYYYCWQQGTTRGKQYIPARKLSTVQEMIDRRCSVDEILQMISKRPSALKTMLERNLKALRQAVNDNTDDPTIPF